MEMEQSQPKRVKLEGENLADMSVSSIHEDNVQKQLENEGRSLSASSTATSKRRVKRTVVRRVKRTPKLAEAQAPVLADGGKEEVEQILDQIEGRTPKAAFQQFDNFLQTPQMQPLEVSPESSLHLMSPMTNVAVSQNPVNIPAKASAVSGAPSRAASVGNASRCPKVQEFEQKQLELAERQRKKEQYNPLLSNVETRKHTYHENTKTGARDHQELVHSEYYQPNRFGTKVLEIRNKDAAAVGPTPAAQIHFENQQRRAAPDQILLRLLKALEVENQTTAKLERQIKSYTFDALAKLELECENLNQEIVDINRTIRENQRLFKIRDYQATQLMKQDFRSILECELKQKTEYHLAQLRTQREVDTEAQKWELRDSAIMQIIPALHRKLNTETENLDLNSLIEYLNEQMLQFQTTDRIGEVTDQKFSQTVKQVTQLETQIQQLENVTHSLASGQSVEKTNLYTKNLELEKQTKEFLEEYGKLYEEYRQREVQSHDEQADEDVNQSGLQV